jgi:SpoVK/Ycf46/Vps4 family AAA+-type ATPase
VGGNRRAKVALQEALALDPVRRGRLEALGLSPPTGILLYGPPGVGKTLLAKAVAALLRQNASGGPAASAAVGSGGAFVSLSSVDLVRAEVGASEKLVVEAFEAARASAPSVVFIDEFQALFADRSASAEGGGSGRMTTSLLECMDDVRKWSDVATGLGASAVAPRDGSIRTGGRVVVLAATNTPWMIDGAFLRPGRFDRAVFVGLPTQDERASILRLHVGRMRTHLAEGGSLNGLCSRLAALTDGFSGADLAALCRAAAVRCLLEASGGGDGALAAKAAVEERHLLEARERDVQASTSDKLVRRIEQWGVRG